jgi:hypothetical protein
MIIRKIGVTATQLTLTVRQKQNFHRIITMLNAREGHHGDCVGGDRFSHTAMKEHSMRIIIHPPIDAKARAFCRGNETREPKDYLVRNHDIVDETEALIAMPKGETEVIRSGTWATVRYARKLHRPIYLLLPSGKIVVENPPKEKSDARERQVGRIRSATF